MTQLVECVPNFSEGRDKQKVGEIVSAARRVQGVRVLDVETDPDHNRCVLTFVAPPEAAVEAAFQAARKASELIDLTVHKGEHPRMGAVDVIPFIPVAGVGLAECAALAKKLGERVARELRIPVYLYGLAAARPERKDLAVVRKGQFEGLRTAIETDPDRAPDFGPRKIHPTAGAVAVGAREQIINFNVNLDLTDIEAGRAIAKKIRTSGGGLPELRAKEIALASGRVQISTVLTDYKKTSLATVLRAVESEARSRGGLIVSCEIVGLTPRDAFLRFAGEHLLLGNFDFENQVLENRLEAAAAPGDWKQAAAAVAEALSTTDATPGGGSAAGISGAMGCALGQMAAGISLKSQKVDDSARKALEEGRRELGEYRDRLLGLMEEDAAAFDKFMEAMKLPKTDPERGVAMQKALVHAAEVPLKTAQAAAGAKTRLMAVAALALPTVASDMQCAGHLLRAAIQCAAENVRINLGGIKDTQAARRIERELAEVLRTAN